MSATTVEAQSGLGFRFEPGYQETGREWGRLLEGAADVDFSLLFGLDRLRIGAGINWSSMRLVDVPDESWQHTTGRLILGYVQPVGSRARLSGELAYVRRNSRPEGSRLFDDGPPIEHIGPFRATGDGVEGRVALEVGLGETTALSLSGAYQRFRTAPYPVDVTIPGVDAGSTWRLGMGLTWFPVEPESTRSPRAPTAPSPGEGPPPGASTGNAGLAVGVGALGLLIPWSWNEYVKGKPFTPVSPRSWGRGVSYGLAWDDNGFEVNYFRHPYHGQFYFNAARSNGYGFGASVLHTVVGSYLWECCTETHVPSLPDMITTVVGGAALGESLHRVSTAIVDERVWGIERVLRESAAALLDPARGFTRLATGRAWMRSSAGGPGGGVGRSTTTTERSAVGAAPLSRLRVVAGLRHMPATDFLPTRTHPLVRFAWHDGDPYSVGNGLFSYHRLDVALYPGDRALLGAFDIRGVLWRSGPDQSGGDHGDGLGQRFSLYLDADYIDTEAYRFATQALTGALAWAVPLTAHTRVGLELEASLVPIGSVDSEYARFARIRGVREREREYDFGTGGGARLSMSLIRNGDAVVAASYRFVALETMNGSNVEGSRSHHLVHVVRAAIRLPVTGGFGLGIDGEILRQDSRYGLADFVDTSRTHPEVRAFVEWRPGA